VSEWNDRALLFVVGEDMLCSICRGRVHRPLPQREVFLTHLIVLLETMFLLGNCQ
jgi:hypothetical protein